MWFLLPLFVYKNSNDPHVFPFYWIANWSVSHTNWNCHYWHTHTKFCHHHHACLLVCAALYFFFRELLMILCFFFKRTTTIIIIITLQQQKKSTIFICQRRHNGIIIQTWLECMCERMCVSWQPGKQASANEWNKHGAILCAVWEIKKSCLYIFLLPPPY